MPLPAVEFYLTRHGQSQSNVEQIMAGSGHDSPLTRLGYEQAAQLGKIIKTAGIRLNHICHSPLIRAAETARVIHEYLESSFPLSAHDDIKEHFVGEWEGKPWGDFPEYGDLNYDPKGGETYAQFDARIKKGLAQALALPAPVLVVTHGGVIYSLGRLFGKKIPRIGNAQLLHFQPLNKSAGFPWQIHLLSLEENEVQRIAIEWPESITNAAR
ncbi:MAG: histidine phosphatase family protein [Dongiaceae bacterium]